MTLSTISKHRVTCTCGRELIAGEGGVFVCVICGFDPADCRCFARAAWPVEKSRKGGTS